MRKVYRYRNLSYPVADQDEVVFSVELVSDGNTSYTVINVPGDNDPGIDNAGSAPIGKGKDLRDEATITFSDVQNALPQEDKIIINYKINGQLIQQHSNDKTEEERPFVILYIKFPKP